MIHGSNEVYICIHYHHQKVCKVKVRGSIPTVMVCISTRESLVSYRHGLFHRYILGCFAVASCLASSICYPLVCIAQVTQLCVFSNKKF